MSKLVYSSQWVVEPIHNDQDIELKVVCQDMGCATERKVQARYTAGAD